MNAEGVKILHEEEFAFFVALEEKKTPKPLTLFQSGVSWISSYSLVKMQELITAQSGRHLELQEVKSPDVSWLASRLWKVLQSRKSVNGKWNNVWKLSGSTTSELQSQKIFEWNLNDVYIPCKPNLDKHPQSCLQLSPCSRDMIYCWIGRNSWVSEGSWSLLVD